MPTPESIRDDLLVLRCQTGEAHAFEMLVERWQLHLLNFAFRLTGNWAAAQDVVQDSWLVVIRGLVGLRDVGRFKPWLFQIASHKCADYWRPNRRATLLAEEFGKAMPVGQEPVATGQAEDLATAFARLSPDHLQPGSEGEIVDTFRVERSKACFHPVILPERGHAETWIAVGPESGPVWYEGPLNDFSRFWFGRGVAVGSYRIRIGPVSAETACRLRMFGVDSPQTGISDPRTLWLMICSALALGIPLVGLQNRLLRGLDPQLAG